MGLPFPFYKQVRLSLSTLPTSLAFLVLLVHRRRAVRVARRVVDVPQLARGRRHGLGNGVFVAPRAAPRVGGAFHVDRDGAGHRVVAEAGQFPRPGHGQRVASDGVVPAPGRGARVKRFQGGVAGGRRALRMKGNVDTSPSRTARSLPDSARRVLRSLNPGRRAWQKTRKNPHLARVKPTAQVLPAVAAVADGVGAAGHGCVCVCVYL